MEAFALTLVAVIVFFSIPVTGELGVFLLLALVAGIGYSILNPGWFFGL